MATSATVRISGKFHCLHEADAVLQSGNLHLNVIADAYTPEIEAALEPFVYELVGELHQRSLMAKKTNGHPRPSQIQGFGFSRARHWCSQDTRFALYEERN
jgi:hypothetical protein